MKMAYIYLICILFLGVASSDRVSRVGNELKASASGVDVARTTFLLQEEIVSSGVVFAFSAFYRSNKPMRFQIWRPSGGSDLDYKLIAEMRHIPSVEYAREDVYIESKLTQKCIRVHPGDRLGIFAEQSPGPVAYRFQKSKAQALGLNLYNKSDTQIGSNVTFGSLHFPYDFSAAAHIDTWLDQYSEDPDNDFVTCPKGLLIPAYVQIVIPKTTAIPVTGRVGATGATGQAGKDGAVGKMGATGPQGEKGENGIEGPSGKDGEDGKMGATGLRGEMGATGIRGPPGPRGDTVDLNDVSLARIEEIRNEDKTPMMKMFESPMFSLAVAVWLAVITLLMVVVFAVVITHNRRHSRQTTIENTVSSLNHGEKPPLEYQKSYLPQPVERKNSMNTMERGGVVSNNYAPPSTTGEPDPAWMSTLKTQAESQVVNQTITSDNEEEVPGYATTIEPDSLYLNAQDSQSSGSEISLMGQNNKRNSDGSEFSRPEMVY